MRYSYTAGHWFRLDLGWWGKGGSIPRPTDWIKLKDLLKFNELYDSLVSEKIAVLQTVKPHEKEKRLTDLGTGAERVFNHIIVSCKGVSAEIKAIL